MVYGETDVNLSHEAVRQRTLAIENYLNMNFNGEDPNTLTFDRENNLIGGINFKKTDRPIDPVAATLWDTLMHGGEVYTDAEILVPAEHTAGGYSGKRICYSGDHILEAVDGHTSITKRRT